MKRNKGSWNDFPPNSQFYLAKKKSNQTKSNITENIDFGCCSKLYHFITFFFSALRLRFDMNFTARI